MLSRTTNYNQHGRHVRTWGRPYPYRFTTNTHQDYFIVISLLRYLLRCLFASPVRDNSDLYLHYIMFVRKFCFVRLLRYNVSEMFMQCSTGCGVE